ncbi:MAG: adenosylhomocysteinase [Eubacteriales bacterium]|nr:adenosylhomocysteinase [Eubacteriales bacterium]
MRRIKDIGLAEAGQHKIDWVRRHMPLLNTIEKQFRVEKPFRGLRLTISVHMEAKTAYMAQVLAAGGAEVYATGCNPLSTQDDVAAALAVSGVNVFCEHGVSMEQYEQDLISALSCRPQLFLDDGGDLTQLLHTKLAEFLPDVRGGTEETTTGVVRLHARERSGCLRIPMMAVNDADCKHLFDNRYGTGQSVMDGIMRTTNLLVAGKTFVVAGYGYCGRGVAMRAKAMGARVIVTEVDRVKAMEAVMDGYDVMPMKEAARRGDVFITVTGCRDVMTQEHFPLLKDEAILCNAGHFDVEVNVEQLRSAAVRVSQSRDNIMTYEMPDGRRINLLAEGRLVNLAAGDGHPAEIMDMSFAIQVLSLRYLAGHYKELEPRVYTVPRELEEEVAGLRLRTWGVDIDRLTDEQAAYLKSWE